MILFLIHLLTSVAKELKREIGLNKLLAPVMSGKGQNVPSKDKHSWPTSKNLARMTK